MALSEEQQAWLTYLYEHRAKLVVALSRGQDSLGRELAQDAVDFAVLRLIEAFIQRPDWPTAKFLDRRSMIGYAAVTARREYVHQLTRVARTERLMDDSQPIDSSIPLSVAAERRDTLFGILAETFGQKAAEIFDLRHRGYSSAEIARRLSRSGRTSRAYDVFDVLVMMKARWAWLGEVLPPYEARERTLAYRLVRHGLPELDPQDAELVAARILGDPFDEIAARLDRRSPAQRHAANALRQRLHRLMLGRHRAWLELRLGGRQADVGLQDAIRQQPQTAEVGEAGALPKAGQHRQVELRHQSLDR